jgi:predicted metalloprotease with PDZ domain
MIATNWNAEIVKASDGKYSLDNVMFDLERTSGGGKQELTPELISKTVQRYLGRDVSPDIARYVTDGETVSPLDGALGNDVVIETQKIPVFDAGFDLDELFRSRRITGVRPDGPAYAAGIRDGQQLAGGVSVYFGNTEKEIELKVKTDDGEKLLKYLPVAAEPAMIPQFTLRSKTDRSTLSN